MDVSAYFRLACETAQQSAPFSSPLLLPLSPPPSFSFTFQTDTVQLFYPKGFKGSLLAEYKTLLPLELLMVAEKQKKVRNTSL